MKKTFSTPRFLQVVHLGGGEMGVFELVFKSTQQEATGGPKVLETTSWLKIGIQFAQNDRGANPHH